MSKSVEKDIRVSYSKSGKGKISPKKVVTETKDMKVKMVLDLRLEFIKVDYKSVPPRQYQECQFRE